MTTANPTLQLLALAGGGLALIVVGIVIALRVTRSSPEKRERARRNLLNTQGRLGDAFITEADDATIFYQYSIHGVHYTASQDVTALRDRLPATPERLIGVANIKYASNNPANSILVSEEWSGLRAPSQRAG